ncbi:MAG TPA: MarR family transcriptional regulator [Gemmatimonadales bacterium]|nr:MarR family transcriptional regulator [Gemmatimonadales bacterium]
MTPPRPKPEPRPPRPVGGVAEAAYLELWRTTELLTYRLAEALRPFGVTPTQYSVLRALRAGGAQGLPCREVARALATRDSDVTRLLDRLERMGLVRRERALQDRRMVTARLTPRGQQVLAELDGLVAQVHLRHFDHLGEAGVRALIRQLEGIREAARR